MTFYELLLFVHIAGAAVWFGAGVMMHVLAQRADRTDDHATLKRLVDDTEDLSNRVFIPASMVVLIAGIVMVIDGPWSFGDLWIVLGLVGFAATMATGLLVIKPSGERIAKLMERDGGMSPEALYETRRMLALARIDYVSLLLVIAVMAIKPTASDGLFLAALAAVLLGGAALVFTRARAIAPPTPAAS